VTEAVKSLVEYLLELILYNVSMNILDLLKQKDKAFGGEDCNLVHCTKKFAVLS
jgi:hypothetical protein